jgi:flavin-dependent dehydrogenase
MMDIKNHYDVVIVGAGPAGAGVSKALTASSLETLMVERDAMPRYKMCSGVLFPGSVKTVADDFGELPEKVFCQPREIKVNRAYLSEEAPCIEVSFSAFADDESLPENGLNIRRAELDQWLCQRSDARIIDHCRFEGCEKEGDGYIIKLKHEGQELTVRSRYLVGADGTMSRVRKTAFPDFDEKIGLIPNYEEFYRGSIDLEPGWLYLFLDRKFTGFFATVFHKDDIIVVVTGVKHKEPVKEYFQAFKKHLEDKHGLRVDEQIGSHGIMLHDMSASKNYCLGENNLLLAGEAGGFLRGGEGITSSLVSGRAAGQAILKSEESGRPAIDFFQELARPELEACEKIHAKLAAIAGFNVFMR